MFNFVCGEKPNHYRRNAINNSGLSNFLRVLMRDFVKYEQSRSGQVKCMFGYLLFGNDIHFVYYFEINTNTLKSFVKTHFRVVIKILFLQVFRKMSTSNFEDITTNKSCGIAIITSKPLLHVHNTVRISRRDSMLWHGDAKPTKIKLLAPFLDGKENIWLRYFYWPS